LHSGCEWDVVSICFESPRLRSAPRQTTAGWTDLGDPSRLQLAVLCMRAVIDIRGCHPRRRAPPPWTEDISPLRVAAVMLRGLLSHTNILPRVTTYRSFSAMAGRQIRTHLSTH
jgi:hypothetical protein